MKNRIDLCGEWQVADNYGTVHKGTVPGCIHTDLFSEHQMFFEKNSQNCRFIEERDWIYRKEFYVNASLDKPMLIFEGLDTYCEIYLNDTKVGTAENMFIPHEFCIEGSLKKGKNLLEVRFFSPIKKVENKPRLNGVFTTERLHTRRMQCTYGWDWVDRFVTCGIFRPVYIVCQNQMQLKDVYVFTTSVDQHSAQIKITEHFQCYENGCNVKTEVISPQGELISCNETWCEEAESILYVDVENPQLWYPNPYGEQPIYTLRITILDTVSYERFGIRTVKILQLKDRETEVIDKCKLLQQTRSGMEYDQNKEYSGFILLVNGVKIFCTGANWVPCEPFPSAETDEKITKILETAVDAGINMVRVWGGGIFEKKHFYDECDRLGVLVTQDFLMACGSYPETDMEFQENLRKEAEFAAIHIRNHPSLVWWSGDNENAVCGDDSKRNYPGRVSARKVIAPVLEKYDYNRMFLFSSPYGGKKYASKTVGTTHNTQFMSYCFEYILTEDMKDYTERWREYTARFIAEEPNMGAVCQSTLNEFIAPENQENYDMWIYHTKKNPMMSYELVDIITQFAEKLFGKFASWEDKYFKLRYIQYEWIRITLGNARSNLWFNSGIVYWMLNDCWPAALGWSLVDYYTRPKSGYYAIRKFGQPMAIYVTKEDACYKVYISSILEQNVEQKLVVSSLELRTNQCKLLYEKYISVSCDSVCQEINVELSETEILIAEIQGTETVVRNWYKEGVPTLERSERIQWRIEQNTMEIWSDTYIHAVEIENGNILSDNYFSLLPGERRKVFLDNVNKKEELEVRGYTFVV